MYKKRHIERVVFDRAKTNPVVLIAGARQVGKSMLLENTVAKSITSVTLDDLTLLGSIKRDVLGFINDNTPPIFIDEIQYAPELFRGIKLSVDRHRDQYGLYFLSGSQKFELMRGVTESLSGRISVLNLLGLSQRELYGDNFDMPFVPNQVYLDSRKPLYDIDSNALWEQIHRGFFPRVALNRAIDWESFYADYFRTYVERDISSLSQVGNTTNFVAFVVALASRTGQLLNIASIAREVGTSQTTIKKWISILEASNIIYLLQPFSLNISSRAVAVKTPKIYFLDTGLVCYLCKWLSPLTLQNGAMSGQVFQSFVVSEILKSYYNAGKEPPIYFYRDNKAKEIDLLFYSDGTINPVEIKKTASPNPKDASNFRLLQNAFGAVTIGQGGLICMYPKVLGLNETTKTIPINFL